jgi:hypothetical protein
MGLAPWMSRVYVVVLYALAALLRIETFIKGGLSCNIVQGADDKLGQFLSQDI